MAHVHNCIIRGMNSIYLQAPYVRLPADIIDFFFYIKAWCDFVHHHHQVEEDIVFPELEAFTGQPGCMGGNLEQHHAFEPRIARLEAYGRETKVESYSGERVRELVQDLGDVLREHLADEIPTMVALEKFPSEGIMKIFKKCEKAAFEYPKLSLPWCGVVKARLRSE
jgi:hemerythrin-like domain-containing protein